MHDKNIPHHSLITFLSSTVYGRKGKLQYKHLNTATRLAQFPNIRFVSKQRHGKLIALVALVPKKFLGAGKSNVEGLYVRYLSVLPSLSRQNKPCSSQKRIAARLKNGIVKNELKNELDNQLKLCLTKGNKSCLSFAYIEAENHYSQELSREFGYVPIRSLRTFVFSRLFPAPHAMAKECGQEERKDFQEHLDRFYAGYQFYPENALRAESTRFVFSVNGEMMAGLQAHPIEWEIVHLPGVSGWVIQKVIPKLPILGPKFDTLKMRFLAFDGVWYREGQSHCVSTLMETACAHFKRNIALFWADSDSPMAIELRKNVSWGMLEKLQRDVPATIIAKWKNVDFELVNSLYRFPAYVSALDLV